MKILQEFQFSLCFLNFLKIVKLSIDPLLEYAAFFNSVSLSWIELVLYPVVLDVLLVYLDLAR